MTSLHIGIENLYLYILVFVRFAGVLIFNPILTRRNVPARIRAALALCASILLTPNLAVPPELDLSQVDLVFGIGRELVVGFVFGYVFILFYYMLMFAGDIMDTQFGLSMAKVMDPGSQTQTAFTGTLLGLLFTAYVFLTNSHLIVIRMAATSYDLIPIGAGNIQLEGLTDFAITLFVAVFSLAIRLTFPFVAVELVLEVSLGILMKLIPQIHVFVINMQFKILLAIVLLFVLAGPICTFLDNYVFRMLEDLESSLHVLTA